MKLVYIIFLICLALHGSLVYADSPLLHPHQTDTIPMEVELADPAMATTPEKRHQLQYLVSCALPQSIVLYTQQGTERFTFPGQMGLAPGWLHHPMTPAEERWVSACMLALVNYFGKHVEVSLRAEPPPVPFFQPSDEEKRQFTLFEGGFFGNLFGPKPVAYVCQGTRTPADDQAPVLHDRVCTTPTNEKTPDGKPMTPCRFILTGPCADSASFTVGGDHYDEVIFVYLKPK
jgi:hypothetical protein